MITTLDSGAALKLWGDLRGHLVNAEKAIAEIIATKAWEPLGYASFAEAWAEKMQGVPLATDSIRAHVVYAMFDCGLSDYEVLDATGVGSLLGPQSITALRGQKNAGMPPSLASTRVRAHLRRAPSEARTVHVSLREKEYDEFRSMAKDRDTSLGELGAELIRNFIKAGA